ncbi:cytochrome P450 [Fusarium albosuccineum]|uniref:Cytochrome P450 n=1 Tax=Fusarium albosuccineum TaxID=1237068 RepID=A0A8H4LH82_9HYPO|nr:cytochrome P450 [Fusarium albosuccineum]
MNEGARDHPGGYLTWAVQHERQIGAIQVNDEEIVDKICSMSIYLVFAITHGPTAVLSQAIISLLHSPRKEEYKAKLLAEMQLVSLQSRAANAEAVWTRDTISRLLMLDSTLRETMRLYPTSAVQPVWNVTKDTTLVAVFIPELNALRPVRFVARKTPLHKSNDAFLSWGAGRTACPGRQYASQIMKLVLVGFLMNYDFKTGNNGASEVGGKAGRWLGPLFIPSTNIKDHFMEP